MSQDSENQALEDDQWAHWALAAQKGDKRAYGELLHALSGYVRSYLAGSLANADWADDITQEVLLSVHKSLATYSADRPFRPWLISIIKFRRADFLRKHYNKRDHAKASLDHPDFLTSYVTNPQYSGEYKDVEKILASLPDDQRTVFQRLKLEGYTAQEVANEMGMSESAVKVSAHRTLKKIKDALGT
ncbi:MAG: sigma-70 family RNA polymerase sigma factor [Alphaproteobacteria bacterium]|nr:sigma-70 family RNA polymerase sigma factor [Alphaproteobacteria bacterium]